MDIRSLFNCKNNPTSTADDFVPIIHETIVDDTQTLPLSAQINLTELRSKHLEEYNKGFIKAYKERVMGVLPLENSKEFQHMALTKGKDLVDLQNHYKQGYNALSSILPQGSLKDITGNKPVDDITGNKPVDDITGNEPVNGDK